MQLKKDKNLASLKKTPKNLNAPFTSLISQKTYIAKQ